MSLDEFARDAGAAAKALRRLPSDLRKALAAEVQTQVAVPLAAKIAGAATGPWAPQLAAGVKARKVADPTIVIGGSRPVVSGGAGVSDLVYGSNFGGGKRIAQVSASRRNRAHRRHTTRQFPAPRPFIFPTIARNGEWVLDQYADIVEEVLNNGPRP